MRPGAMPAGYGWSLVGAGLFALLSGVVLFAARHFALPFGGLTLLVALSAALMLLVHATYMLLPTLLAAGLLADVLYARLRPTPRRRAAFRAFAALVPATTFVLVLASLLPSGVLTWSVTLLAGAVTLAGMIGWLLSFVFLSDGPDQTR